MKLIDADALWMEFIHRMDYCDDILEIVDEMPEAVVRCKDCRWSAHHREADGNVPWWSCGNWECGTYADGFCHDGERKTDETD